MLLFVFRIIGSGSEYKINGEVVSHTDYNKKLESIGIYVKAKNFLVFQVNLLIFLRHYPAGRQGRKTMI